MKSLLRKGFTKLLMLLSVMFFVSTLSPLDAISASTNFTIWPSTAVPVVVDAGPEVPVEMGLKFRSDSSGTISSIRFYKASANTGTHVGNLWTDTGTLLATATFTNESASGWQQVDFSSPVPVTANTVYVASYHTPTGHYSYDTNFFLSNGVDSPPLHALANGISGVNGLFTYGAAGSFPIQGWNSTNYWVDVVFNANTPPPPPAPANGSTIWPDTTVPSIPAATDGQPIEVGVKFRSDVNGSITGLRFYKGSINNGTHVGNLWTRDGILLSSATFVNETASGWQEVTFPTPVAITANTTYVASYHSASGYFNLSTAYFATIGVDSPPLHALANGTDGVNGVYQYGTSAFPTQNSNSGNYWVDAVFNQTAPPNASTNTMSYTYDDLNRLIKIQSGDGKITDYGYDEVGNRLSTR